MWKHEIQISEFYWVKSTYLIMYSLWVTFVLPQAELNRLDPLIISVSLFMGTICPFLG